MSKFFESFFKKDTSKTIAVKLELIDFTTSTSFSSNHWCPIAQGIRRLGLGTPFVKLDHVLINNKEYTIKKITENGKNVHWWFKKVMFGFDEYIHASAKLAINPQTEYTIHLKEA